MQHIAALVKPTPNAERASTPKPSREDSRRQPTRWIEQLFARFAIIWPKAWADTVGSVPRELLMAEWADGLAGLSGEQIKAGIDDCRARLTWPPSIAEFRTACLGHANATQRAFTARLADADAERLALPSRTWTERRADGQRQARELLALLRERERAESASESGCLVERKADALAALNRRMAARQGAA